MVVVLGLRTAALNPWAELWLFQLEARMLQGLVAGINGDGLPSGHAGGCSVCRYPLFIPLLSLFLSSL